MAYPVEVEFREPNNLYVEYSDSLSGVIELDDILNHKDYREIKDSVNPRNVGIAEDKDILIDGKIKLCKNATYSILQLKNQMKKLGLEL